MIETSPVLEADPAQESLRPLCVDLDGTLVKSDTLVDSLLVLARTRPSQLFRLPFVLPRGKAAVKQFVASHVSLHAASLPFNAGVVDFLQAEYARGREIYLTTGADISIARCVADHLGIFAGVFGSDGVTNLTGTRKLDLLNARFGSTGFDYIGNDTPDVALLAHSTHAMIANPTGGLRRRLAAAGIRPAQTFIDRQPAPRLILRAVRVHQWAKNLLIFVPLLCSHDLSTNRLLMTIAALCCFSLTASSAYIVNDLLDIEADRCHTRKQQRPFASGDLSVFTGVALALLFLAAGLAGAALLPGRFLAWLLLYLATTLVYTGWLKRIPLVDVMTLSGLYILRLLAGGAVTHTPISPWLAGFSLFLFLSLAIVKRFAELESLRRRNAEPANGRGYVLSDEPQLRSLGTSSAYAAVVVFAIYISSSDVMRLYHHPQYLWLTVPLMTLWLNRVWLLASRGELNEDPVAFALTDAVSLVIGLGVLGVAFLAL